MFTPLTSPNEGIHTVATTFSTSQLSTGQSSPAKGFGRRMLEAQPTLAKFAAITAASAGVTALLGLVDHRQVLDVNTWIKPTKFFLSTSAYAATLAWAFQHVHPDQRSSRRAKFVVGATVGAGVLELVIITARAALAQQSHFNTGTALDSFWYNVMAVGALTLVSTAAVLGRMVWQSGVLSGARRIGWAAGLGLAGTFGAVTGMVMGGGTGHMVSAAGRVATSTSTIPFLGWATDIGDLRIAHFAALHAMFVLPLLGWLAARRLSETAAARVTAAASIAWTAVIIGVMANALAGNAL